MPPKVFDQMYDHILTDKGLEIFDRDAALILYASKKTHPTDLSIFRYLY